MNFDNTVLQVAIEDIVPNRFQPRKVFDERALSDLATSIKEHGIIQPIVLRRLGDKYEIVAGERRYRASMLAGLTSIPAVISNISDKKSAEVAIAENVQRKSLSAIEEAKSYKAVLDLGYMDASQLANRMGISESSLNNKIRLLDLSDRVQDAVMKGDISERHAKSLLVIDDKNAQDEWLTRIINERMNVRILDQELKKEFGDSVFTSKSSKDNSGVLKGEEMNNNLNNFTSDFNYNFQNKDMNQFQSTGGKFFNSSGSSNNMDEPLNQFGFNNSFGSTPSNNSMDNTSSTSNFVRLSSNDNINFNDDDNKMNNTNTINSPNLTSNNLFSNDFSTNTDTLVSSKFLNPSVPKLDNNVDSLGVDFLDNSNPADFFNKPVKKDISEAVNIINKAVQQIRESGYLVSMNQDQTSDKISFKITVE